MGRTACLVAVVLVALTPAPASAVPRSIRIVSPNGGETFAAGEAVVIVLATTEPASQLAFQISDGQSGPLWTGMDVVAGEAGTFRWTPPPGLSSTRCLLRVIGRDLMAESADYFVIAAPTIPCSATAVLSPAEDPVEVTFELGGIGECGQYEDVFCMWDFGDDKWSFEHSPTYTYPFFGGTFRWELRTFRRDGTGSCSHRGLVTISTRTGLLLAGGKVRVTASYRSPYGRYGEADAVPVSNESGYFTFSEAGNPEVMVKVLDFGPDEPYLLFAAQLTNFKVRVAFTNLENGKTRLFENIAAGSLSLADKAALSREP